MAPRRAKAPRPWKPTKKRQNRSTPAEHGEKDAQGRDELGRDDGVDAAPEGGAHEEDDEAGEDEAMEVQPGITTRASPSHREETSSLEEERLLSTQLRSETATVPAPRGSEVPPAVSSEADGVQPGREADGVAAADRLNRALRPTTRESRRNQPLSSAEQLLGGPKLGKRKRPTVYGAKTQDAPSSPPRITRRSGRKSGPVTAQDAVASTMSVPSQTGKFRGEARVGAHPAPQLEPPAEIESRWPASENVPSRSRRGKKKRTAPRETPAQAVRQTRQTGNVRNGSTEEGDAHSASRLETGVSESNPRERRSKARSTRATHPMVDETAVVNSGATPGNREDGKGQAMANREPGNGPEDGSEESQSGEEGGSGLFMQRQPFRRAVRELRRKMRRVVGDYDLSIQSKKMKSLRKQISKARDLAIQAKVDGSPHVQLADKCRATVKKIAGVIRNLGEDTDNEKTGEVGQDLYVFVLPEMFGLLDMIITYLDQDDHVSSPAIAEILEFIRLIQTLCETAEGWKREVINSIPVYRAIKSAAMQLGAMEEVLSRELARIIKGVRDRKQQKWLEERREKFEEEQARRTAEHQQRVFERRLRINEQLQKTTHPRFATYIRVDDDLWTPPRSSTGILLPLSDHQRPGAGQVPTVGVAGEQEDNEMVERVHMFDRRTDPPVDRSLWTLLETEALIEGLERFTGPDRYLQILEEYSNRGDALCERDIDQLHAKAKEIRSDLLTDMAMHPESSEQPAPDWLLSIR